MGHRVSFPEKRLTVLRIQESAYLNEEIHILTHILGDTQLLFFAFDAYAQLSFAFPRPSINLNKTRCNEPTS